jgi:hypothetical protein
MSLSNGEKLSLQKKVNEWPFEHKKEVFRILEQSGFKTQAEELMSEFNKTSSKLINIDNKIDKQKALINHLFSTCTKAFNMVDDKNFESIEVTKKNITALAESVEGINSKAGDTLQTMKALNLRMLFSKMFYLVIGALMGVMFSQSFNFIIKLYCYAPESPKITYILFGLGGILPGVIIGAFLSNRN